MRELEGRLLMTAQGPSGVWLGQDGHDLVGPWPGFGPDDVQDMHIAVSGLPADHAVVKTDTFGYGGGEWIDHILPSAPSYAAWVQSPGATTADLYLDCYMVETGRVFTTVLTFDDGTTAIFDVAGGAADPNLRMPGKAVSAQWAGQDGHDLTGAGPNVGPDGFQDVRIALSGLSASIGITSADLVASSGAAWSYGTNPGMASNAEFVRDSSDPTKGLVWITPTASLEGQSLTLTLHYNDGKSDHTTFVAGASDPSLRMPATSPVPVQWGTISAAWIGQDGTNLVGSGDVHLGLSGLVASRSVVSATLSDESRGAWIYQASGSSSGTVDPDALPLGFRRSASDPSRGDLTFPPMRDESGATLTLRLVLDDGTILTTRFSGGACDPGLRAPDVAPTSVVARPGDDLGVLVNQYGTVHLTAGTYPLDHPLFLQHAVTITADPGATLLFSQGPSDPAWTTAINVECGHTTLDGFSVRFAGPIRWTTDVPGGPTVIGNSYAIDGGSKSTLLDIALTHLDLLSPPPSSSWEEAPRLIWMTTALSGVISGNTLRGGMTEFSNGPWQITGNNYQGTVPGTFCYGAFAGHNTVDLLLADNTVQPVSPSGKTWRFLVLTNSGHDDVIRNNQVVGIGPMDNDTVPNPNSSETILTESYGLHFEGAPTVISTDGWVVQIPTPQGGTARTGDVVSILSGPDAGQWRRIAQAINSTAYLLDAPISPGDTAISISTGFVGETFQGNTIDARGSSTALDMVFVGNHFGTQVLDNHILGGNRGFFITAAPTEMPNIWGWSRAPVLGATIAGNTLEDTRQGGLLDVEHGSVMKSDLGRTYMSVSLLNNTIVWSQAFLTAIQADVQGPPPTFTIGDSLSNDPTSLLLKSAGNAIQGPAAITAGLTWVVHAATVNGQPMVEQRLPFASPPAAPTGLALVNDTGASSTDLITKDARLRFDALPSVAGYEYSTTGQEGSFQPVSSPDSFLPAGLQKGGNTVWVRGYDARGQRGPSATITFEYRPVGPSAIKRLIAMPHGLVQFQGTGPGDVYEYRLGGSGVYVPLGTGTSFTTSDLLKGPRTVQVHAIDLAGNVGRDSITTIQPQWVSVLSTGPAPRQAPGAPASPSPIVSTRTPVKMASVHQPASIVVAAHGPTSAWDRHPFPFAHRIQAERVRPRVGIHGRNVSFGPAALPHARILATRRGGRSL